jgi:HSP20 family protein
MSQDMEHWLQTEAKPNYDERQFAPPAEILEADEHFMMTMDLPGMNKDDIKIEVQDKNLVISGERKRTMDAENKYRFQRYEKSYGFFKRSFVLPASVQTDLIEARYENGVLELYLPKAASAQPRKIEIRKDTGGFFDRFLGQKKSSPEIKDVSGSASKVS